MKLFSFLIDIFFPIAFIILCVFLVIQFQQTSQQNREVLSRLSQVEKKQTQLLTLSNSTLSTPTPTFLPELTDDGMYRYQDNGFLFIFSPDYSYTASDSGQIEFSNSLGELAFSVVHISDIKQIEKGIDNVMITYVSKNVQEIDSEEKKINTNSFIKKTYSVCESADCVGLTAKREYIYGVKIKDSFVLFHNWGIISDSDFESTILSTLTAN